MAKAVDIFSREAAKQVLAGNTYGGTKKTVDIFDRSAAKEVVAKGFATPTRQISGEQQNRYRTLVRGMNNDERIKFVSSLERRAKKSDKDAQEAEQIFQAVKDDLQTETTKIGRFTRGIDRPGDLFAGLGTFAAGSNERFLGGTGRAITRINPLLDKTQKEAVIKGFFPEATEEEKQSKLFRAGQTGGTIQKGALDTALLFAGGEIAGGAVGATKIPAALATLGKVGKVASKAVPFLAESLGGTGAELLQEAGRGNKVNVGRSALIGTGIDLAVGVPGKGIKVLRSLKQTQKILEAGNIFKAIQDLPDEVLLLSAPKSTLIPGGTMTDEAVSPELLKKLTRIDQQISSIRSGSRRASAVETRNLMRAREEVITQIQNGPIPGGAVTPEPTINANVAQSPTPVTQTVSENLPTSTVPTSRAPHYEGVVQKQIRAIEQSPEYLEGIKTRGGGEVISNVDTHVKALELGPVDESVLLNATPQGKTINSVDTVRARATVEAAATDYIEALKRGADDLELQDKLDLTRRLEEGYHILTGETGRTLQIMSTFSDKSLKAAKRIQEYAGTGKLTTGQRKAILKDLEDLANDANKPGLGARAKEAAARRIAELEEYATAVKLTSPWTHAKNIVGNLVTSIGRAGETAISVGVRAAKGETGLGEAKYVFGTRAGVINAAANFTRAMGDVLTLRGAEGFGREGVEQLIKGKKGKFIRIPFRFLEAADEFGKTILRDSEIHARAYERAFQEGFRGKQLAKRINDLVESPPEDFLARADQVAKEFTFQKDPGKALSAASNFVSRVPGGRLFVPFIRTPANIIKFQARRSVLGAPFDIAKAFSKTATSLEKSEAVGRLVVGAAASAGAYSLVSDLYDQGRITGPAPSEEGARNLFYSQGKRPYSIKFGNKWYSFQAVQPAGMYILQAYGIKDALQNKKYDSASEIAGVMMGTYMRGFTELPFVTGLNTVMEALTAPNDESWGGKFERAITQPIAGFIPNISRDIANWGDDVQRYPKGLRDQVFAMIPGLKSKVTPRVTVTGELQKGEENPFFRSIVKGVSTQKKDRLLDALEQIYNETGYTPSPPSDTNVAGRDKLTRAEHVKYQELAGKYFASELSRALDNASFQNKSAEDKKFDIEGSTGMVGRARERARDELFGKKEESRSNKKRKKY